METNGREEGYKVVSVSRRGRYWSWLGWNSPGSIQYKKNVPVKPHKHCGPLCVYSNLEAAKQLGEGGNSIFKCFYKPSRECAVFVSRGWMVKRIGRLPDYTVLADEVIITGEAISRQAK